MLRKVFRRFYTTKPVFPPLIENGIWKGFTADHLAWHLSNYKDYPDAPNPFKEKTFSIVMQSNKLELNDSEEITKHFLNQRRQHKSNNLYGKKYEELDNDETYKIDKEIEKEDVEREKEYRENNPFRVYELLVKCGDIPGLMEEKITLPATVNGEEKELELTMAEVKKLMESGMSQMIRDATPEEVKGHLKNKIKNQFDKKSHKKMI